MAGAVARLMNSRRLIGSSAQWGPDITTSWCETLLCTTAKLIVKWQSWVNHVDFGMSALGLLSRGSPIATITTRIVVVAAFAAWVAGVPLLVIRSTRSRTRSSAKAGKRSG
jgi:hypothetical protein